MIVNVWNILVALFLCAYFGDGCRFGPEPNCGFPCRCTGDNECDTDTGECDPGSRCQSVLPDGYGWQGQGCRIGNVAYTNHQNVEQLGQYDFYTASLAVDGNINPYISSTNGESCAHPYNSASRFDDFGPYAWWWVDLGNIFNIQRITIVNRLSFPRSSQPQEVFNRRSTDYNIKVGNTSNRSEQTLCFSQDKDWRDVKPLESFTCYQQDMVGRYVSFTRTEGANPEQAAICEFIVMGYMVVECDTDNCVGNCDPVIGCDTCVAGKMLPDCQIECPDGYWGENCANQCGQCKEGVVCDKETGSCGGQCDGWFIPELCTDELRRPTLENARVTYIASDIATVSWDRPTGFSVNIRQYFFYIVKYGKTSVGEDGWDVSERMYISSGVDDFQYNLVGLHYNTVYNVKVQAHRELNGQSVIGTAQTSSFKTLCKAPEGPPTPSYFGTPDTFTVMWESVANLVSGCDGMKSLEITITCENHTQTNVNETWDLPLTNTGFNYAAETAVSCHITLTLTNNMGMSTSSLSVEVTATTTVPPTFESTQSSSYPTTIKVVDKQANTGQETSPNIAAIAGGAAGGVVLLFLIAVVVVIVVRRRHQDKHSEERQTPGNAGDSTKPTPVYQNTKPTGAEYYNAGFDVTKTAEYAAIDDNQVAKKSGTSEKGKQDLYENTKGTGPQYESLQEVKDQNISPVYQALA